MKATLLFLLLFPLTATAAPSYAGTWILDVPASTSMPERFLAGLDQWRLDVSQTSSELTVAIDITSRRHPTVHEVHAHKLDGTPGTFETTMRTPNGEVKVPMTSVAKVDADGTIEFTMEGEAQVDGMQIKRTTKERWELSEDGQTLTVHREEGGRRGTTTFDMVFRRAAK